jgi:uncharacterized protein (DUF1330 family)
VSVYVIVERIAYWDNSFVDEYVQLARATYGDYGARRIVLSYKNTLLEGDTPAGDLFAILEFPSEDAAKRWHASPEYQAAIQVRNRGSKDRMVIIDAGDSHASKIPNDAFELPPSPAG